MAEDVGRRRRLRRARQRRGAFIVEAVFTLPLFIIVFAAAIFLGKLYREKLDTLQASKAKAWAEAMQSCVQLDAQAALESIGLEQPDTETVTRSAKGMENMMPG